MKVKMILPALQEAESPYWRPIKYSLFPPLGLATLAAYFRDNDEVEIVDQHKGQESSSLMLDKWPPSRQRIVHLIGRRMATY